jgi:rRNA-processing protein FCF1
VVADLYNPLKGRYRAWPRKTLERICEAYVEDDADKSIIREALRHYCDAFVTSDRKLARNPTIVHYIPLFHTKNFNQTIKEGYRTRKQLEKEAFKMMNK